MKLGNWEVQTVTRGDHLMRSITQSILKAHFRNLNSDLLIRVTRGLTVDVSFTVGLT